MRGEVIDMTYEFDDDVLNAFLGKQLQLFPEEVASSIEEAQEFLEDCMAVVCNNLKEVREYFEEAGTDIAGLSNDELLDENEVFEIGDGRFLIVEG